MIRITQCNSSYRELPYGKYICYMVSTRVSIQLFPIRRFFLPHWHACRCRTTYNFLPSPMSNPSHQWHWTAIAISISHDQHCSRSKHTFITCLTTSSHYWWGGTLESREHQKQRPRPMEASWRSCPTLNVHHCYTRHPQLHSPQWRHDRTM